MLLSAGGQLLQWCWIFLQLAVGIHLFFPIIFYCIWKYKARRDRLGLERQEDEPVDYAVIITAYKEVHQLESAVKSVLECNYPSCHIYVVADGCAHGSFVFDHPLVSVLYPERVIASNVGSHRFAISKFVRQHEWFAILDSDNLMDANFLSASSRAIRNGFEALQGVRKPKNLNTDIACLDAARDIYYHFYDGKVLFELGSSATLAGSGMAFKTAVYLACFEEIGDLKGAGFDKVLQFSLVNKTKRIAYVADAIVWDEKTSKSDQLVNQRARWINTWFRYFYKGFYLLVQGLKNFNINQLLFGFVLLRPPLFIMILFALIGLVLNIWIAPIWCFYWAVGLLLFCLGFFLSLREENTDERVFISLRKIPIFVYYQIKALVFARNANVRSVSTNHGVEEFKEP